MLRSAASEGVVFKRIKHHAEIQEAKDRVCCICQLGGYWGLSKSGFISVLVN